MEQEIWKPVVGYEGLYEVSNLGRVRSVLRTVREKGSFILKGRILVQGHGSGKKEKYRHVCLCRNGKGHTLAVHRLVAIAFIPNPYNLPHINHKDENPSNNKVANLEWCTAKYNHNYGTIKQRQVETSLKNNSYMKGMIKKVANKSKNAPKMVARMTEDGRVIDTYFSATEAGRTLNIDMHTIRDACAGRTIHAGGYRWKYV